VKPLMGVCMIVKPKVKNGGFVTGSMEVILNLINCIRNCIQSILKRIIKGNLPGGI